MTPSATFTTLTKPMEAMRRIIWIALNVAIFIYVLVACLRFGVPSTFDGAFSHPMALPLGAIAAATAMAARVVPTLLLSGKRMHAVLHGQPDLQALARNQQTGAVDEERLAKIRTLPPHEQRLLAAIDAAFAPFIAQLALNESVALFGLVLALLSKTAASILPFAAAALLSNFGVSPAVDSVRKLLPGTL